MEFKLDKICCLFSPQGALGQSDAILDWKRQVISQQHQIILNSDS
ncbi:hypothetical protein [Desmonostoc muscorum]|nr:hypothetical protein [Desmonostoc muscorum]